MHQYRARASRNAATFAWPRKPAGGVRNSNWGGVHARDYKKASPGISGCLALHALPAAYQRIWSTHSGGVEEILAPGSSTRPHRPGCGPDLLRLASPLPGISSGGSYVHPAFGMELDLDSRRHGLRFFRFDTAASRDEAAKITRTVSRSALISTKASFENNGESHMKRRALAGAVRFSAS